MKQLPLQQIRQLCCVPAKSCQLAAFGVPPCRHTLSLRRHFARQCSLRTIAQARKSLLLRELASGKADMQDDEDDSQVPSGWELEEVLISVPHVRVQPNHL